LCFITDVDSTVATCVLQDLEFEINVPETVSSILKLFRTRKSMPKPQISSTLNVSPDYLLDKLLSVLFLVRSSDGIELFE
jgi:hypothetical protein